MNEKGLLSVNKINLAKAEQYNFEGNKWEMTTNLDNISLAISKLEEQLEDKGWDDDDTYAIKSSFSELLWNAFLHGNLGIKDQELKKDDMEKWVEVAERVLIKNPELTKKKVYISIDITETEAKVSIRDEGAGFDERLIADPTTEKTKFKYTGRGIFHARKHLDQLSFTFDNGTIATMIKRKVKQQHEN